MNLPDAKPKTLSFSEEKVLETKIRQLQDASDGIEVEGMQGVNYQARDKKVVDEKLAKLKEMQAANKVERATGPEREKLEIREKLLRAELDPGISYDKYISLRRKDGIPYLKLVQQIVKFDADNVRQQKISEWKRIRRRLEPEDRDASNVMHLFYQD